MTAGDPDLPRSAEILRRSSAPAPTSSRSACRSPIRSPTARSSSARPSGRSPPAAACARRWRSSSGSGRTSPAPIVLFSYANPLLRLGLDAFARRAAERRRRRRAGARSADRGGGRLPRPLAAAGIDTIFLLSPTTTDARIRRAAELGSGFLYGISRLGVTGARDRVASGAEALVRRIRAATRRCRSRSASASRGRSTWPRSAAYADAAVVGSALVSLIAEAGGVAGSAGDGWKTTCAGSRAPAR